MSIPGSINNKKVRRIICIFSMLSVLLLLLDNNLMIRAAKPETVASKKVEFSTNKRGREDHATLFIVDSSNRKYKVPGWCYRQLHLSDSFSVTRSAIFKKAIRIQFKKEGDVVTENIGVINGGLFGIGICITAILLAALVVFTPGIFKKEEQQFTAFFLSIILTVVVIAFYFIFST